MREQGRASEGKQKDVEKAVGEVNDVDDGGQHYTVFKMESLINWDFGRRRVLYTAMYDRSRMIALSDTTDGSNRRSIPTRLPNENAFDRDGDMI